MLLPKFDFHEPASVEEACQVMAEFKEKAKPLAGGTDLMVNMKKKIVSPEQIVSLGRIDTLKDLSRENGTLKIGACFTVADLAVSETVQKLVSALGSGGRALGSPLVRNLATIGGNIGSARPAADLPPSLMAYGARLSIESSRGSRELDIEKFFKGPGMTALAPDEVITAIHVDIPGPGAGAGYINIGVRRAQDCNIVNVASFLALDEKDGAVKTARIVMGSVGPTPMRAPTAEKVLVGSRPDASLFAEAAAAAEQDCSPILDFRGSAEYRRAMVGVLTRRTLEIALKEAQRG
ncbi:MAG: xanthine dehydrogenase family protein subunit M [Desulfobacterales bacterium]|nr:xanthine dehydrogenase family protein subunit M [Desulfobacterales bacterium]